MARNLIKGGRDVVVWNRTGSKAVEFSKQTGCEKAQTPREVTYVGARARGFPSSFARRLPEMRFVVCGHGVTRREMYAKVYAHVSKANIAT